jgi:hypothetical protein
VHLSVWQVELKIERLSISLGPAASANTISHFERSEMSRQRVNRVKRESNSACCVAVYVCVEQSCQVPLVFCFVLSFSSAPCGYREEAAANRLTHASERERKGKIKVVCMSGVCATSDAEESASGSLSVTFAIFTAQQQTQIRQGEIVICV